MISQDHGGVVRKWIVENLDFIKSMPDSKPRGHKGVVFGIQDIQSAAVKRILLEQNFPYNELKYIEEELINKYNMPVNKYAESGIMMVYSEEGYKCKWHTDTTDDQNSYTTRLNVLLSKPEQGGEPIIKKIDSKLVIPVEKNEPWICVAGKYKHSTVKTKGKTPRILLSFGYDIPKVMLENFNYI
tara:strand:+ start:157 stop:711 length:555 start_codon:yes stop_codon:yes gene_type:complete